MKKRVVWAVLAAVLMCLCASVAVAAEPFDALSEAEKVELIELIDSGTAAYDAGEFQTAVELFHRAYELAPLPDFLYRLGLAYERLGEDARAVEYYRSFLNAEPQAEERGRIESTIEVIEGRLARRARTSIEVITRPEGARVYVGSREDGMRGVTPIELNVEPGEYRLIVELEGYEVVEEQVQVPQGQRVVLRPGLTPQGGFAEADRSVWRSTWVPVSLAVVGAGALVLTPVFNGLANDAAAERSELLQDRRSTQNEVDKYAIERREATYRGLTIGAAVVGGAAITTAGALLVWQLLADDAGAGAEQAGLEAVGVGPLGDTVGVGLRGRF
ncbi:PEGA domain-containing protein [Lujinxingia litoralis]|nr:PEGA domain-containing protein [Lujinxingia litoralis]